MFDQAWFEDMSQSLFSVLPASVRETEQALKMIFQDQLKQACAQVSWVTREEFDVQKKVLARTREKVEALQQQLATHLSKSA